MFVLKNSSLAHIFKSDPVLVCVYSLRECVYNVFMFLCFYNVFILGSWQVLVMLDRFRIASK